MKRSFLAFAVVSFLAASVSAANLAVQPGATRSIPPDFLGLNGNLTNMKEPWNNPRFVQAMQSLSLGCFRYPGGTIGNDWDWDIGWIGAGPKINPYGRHLHPLDNRYTLENLARGQKAAGFTPIFMLNMITEDLTNQMAALKRAQALGMPVRLVELGNEFYLQAVHEPAAVEKFPTAADYARAASEWAAAIKAQFPGVKIAAIGAISGGKNAEPRRETWDLQVAPNLKNVDALTIHIYPNTAISIGADKGEGLWGGAEEQQKLWDALHSSHALARMLGEPAQSWHNVIENTKGLPRDMEFWITEFNMHDRIGPARYTWASGLYIAEMLNIFLSDSRVTHACYHNAAGLQFAPYWNRADDLKANLKINGTQDLTVQPGTLTAIGHSLQFFCLAMRGQTAATPLEFAHAPVVSIQHRAPYPSVMGWTFSGGTKTKSILVNLSDDSFSVDTACIAPSDTAFSQIFAPALEFIVNERSLGTQQGRLKGPLALPAYSMTLIGD